VSRIKLAIAAALKAKAAWERIPPAQRRKLLEQARTQGPVIAKKTASAARTHGPEVARRLSDAIEKARKAR
jgi:hypothetical protein